MNIITLDCETYFDKDYSLSKLSTEAYVRDPRFELHGAAIKHGDDETRWYDYEILNDLWAIPGWARTDAVLCHHTQFDGLILSHHYGIRPALWLDTLSMARLLLGNHVKHSLDGIRQQLGLPPKTTPYNLFKGLHWYEMSNLLQEQIAIGACDEVDSIYTIFHKFIAGTYACTTSSCSNGS